MAASQPLPIFKAAKAALKGDGEHEYDQREWPTCLVGWGRMLAGVEPTAEEPKFAEVPAGPVRNLLFCGSPGVARLLSQAEERWDRIVAPKANLSRANLSRADLYGANLSRANLYGANLYGANLYGANLYGANLSEASLSRADLSGANLSRANLSRADLYGADLYGANLSRANLSRADLYGANLYGANLSEAKTENAIGLPKKEA